MSYLQAAPYGTTHADEEYRADIVVLLREGDVPIWVLIVEVQLGIDPQKRFSWPEYTTGSRAKHRCPVGLLVVAPDPEIAAWCAEREEPPNETRQWYMVCREPALAAAA